MATLTRRLATSSLIVLVATGFPLPGRSAETLLRWKLREGQILEQHLSTTTTGSMTLLGEERKTEQSIQVESAWKIGTVSEDGRARVEQSVERIRAKIQMPMQPVQSYDSKEKKRLTGPAAGMLNKVFDAFQEGTTTFVISAAGKPEEIKFPDGLLKAIRGAGPLGQAGSVFSEESLEEMLGSLPAFPDGPVGEGTSWDAQHELKLPFGSLKVLSTYTYEGKETKEGRELERIGIKNSMSFTKGEGEMPLEIEFKSVESSGRALFDAEAGRYVEQTVEQKMVIAVVTGGGPPMESTTATTTVLELVERKPEPKAEAATSK